MNLESSRRILKDATARFSPTHIVSMVSGGKDSATSHAVLAELGVKPDLIIHGNTRCGIPDTGRFVESHYGKQGPDFAISDAGTAYEDYVLRKGFFGKGRQAHNFSYRVLKAQPFRKTISRCIRKGRRNIRILLVNGARSQESKNRAKNLPVFRSDPASKGNIWVNIIHDWTAHEREEYLTSRGVPINPVAKLLCRSGECMCGTMQTQEQRKEAALFFPEWGNWLDNLEAEARKIHGFGWGQAFPRKQDGQLEMFQPMCMGCAQG